MEEKDIDKSKDKLIKELRAQREETSRLKNILSESESITKMGNCEWDIENDVIIFSEGWKRVLGLKKNYLSMEEMFLIVYPDDLPSVKKAFRTTFDTSKPYDIEHRIIRQDNGEVRHIKVHGKLIRSNGKPIKMYATAQDVTESKQLNDELKEKIEDYNHLYNNLNDSVFVLGLEGNIIDVNDTASNILGYTKKELHSMHVKDVSNKYAISIKKKINQIIKNKQLKFESVYVTKNGDKIPVEVNSTLIQNKGEPVILSIARDITKRKNVEKQLQRKIEEQKALLSSIPAFVYLKDNKLNYITINDAFSEMIEISTDNIKGKTDFDIFPKDNAEKFREYDSLVMETGKPIYNLEENYTTLDGKSRWALTSKIPYFDTNGNVIGIVGTSLDITERKHIYESLKNSEKEKSIILSSTSEQITYQDLDYKIKWYNKAVSDCLGLNYKDLIDKYCYNLWIGANIKTPCENCPVKICIETGKHEENNMGTPDCRVWNVRADPVRDSNGHMVGVIKIANEITEKVKTEKKLKKYARELRKINRELEERVQEQTEQIKNAERTRELELHHRIKNNLQVISSLLNLQSEKFDDEKVNEAFKDTQNRVVSMSLVHQKLYQTKDLESINLKDYIEDLVSHLTGLYGENNTNININVQDINFGIDTIIPLGMVINELVSNSLKYAFSSGEQGEINIELYQDNKKYHTLIVTDNGRGMPEDIDIRNTKSLGLQLVNSLIDQINGDFELEINNGTKFIIKFSG